MKVCWTAIRSRYWSTPPIVLILASSPNPVLTTVQVEKTRAEADEYCARLAQVEREAQAVRGEVEKEIEEVRRGLLGRLEELEPLPEALRRSELQLQEARDRERSQERRGAELSATLTDLRMKVTTVRCKQANISIKKGRISKLKWSF